MAESITTFFEIGQAVGGKRTPRTEAESVEKDHGRLEIRRCWAFAQLDCLAEAYQRADLRMFGVIETQRTLNGKTSRELRLYIGSIAPEATLLAHAVRAHWDMEKKATACSAVWWSWLGRRACRRLLRQGRARSHARSPRQDADR